MASSSLLTDAQRSLQSCSPAGLTVTRLEIVDDVAQLTLAFTPEALERVVEEQLRTVGAPSDWEDPRACTEPGSPTWAYAQELAELFNEHYLKHTVFERHEGELESVLAAHGHEGTPIVVDPAYHPSCLVHVLRRLKKAHPRGATGGARASNAA
ncbi:hypothetical protein ACH9EU_18065 [Kocuria sp. M1R5S2]|uniref:hypothetical protein n=1 Tax=Kocuria rhizosphaerae TaxID=3376285 RepID=UPI00378A0304